LETVRNVKIVTMDDGWEIVCPLSNCIVSIDLECQFTLIALLHDQTKKNAATTNFAYTEVNWPTCFVEVVT